MSLGKSVALLEELSLALKESKVDIEFSINNLIEDLKIHNDRKKLEETYDVINKFVLNLTSGHKSLFIFFDMNFGDNMITEAIGTLSNSTFRLAKSIFNTFISKLNILTTMKSSLNDNNNYFLNDYSVKNYINNMGISVISIISNTPIDYTYTEERKKKCYMLFTKLYLDMIITVIECICETIGILTNAILEGLYGEVSDDEKHILDDYNKYKKVVSEM